MIFNELSKQYNLEIDIDSHNKNGMVHQINVTFVHI